eukprot:1683031-Amphidinium_carterae.1
MEIDDQMSYWCEDTQFEGDYLTEFSGTYDFSFHPRHAPQNASQGLASTKSLLVFLTHFLILL